MPETVLTPSGVAPPLWSEMSSALVDSGVVACEPEASAIEWRRPLHAAKIFAAESQCVAFARYRLQPRRLGRASR